MLPPMTLLFFGCRFGSIWVRGAALPEIPRVPGGPDPVHATDWKPPGSPVPEMSEKLGRRISRRPCISSVLARIEPLRISFAGRVIIDRGCVKAELEGRLFVRLSGCGTNVRGPWVPVSISITEPSRAIREATVTICELMSRRRSRDE